MRFSLPSFTAIMALASQISAAVVSDITMDERYLVRRALRTGLGTRYGDDCTEENCWQSGACSFTDYTLPASVDGSTCVSEEIWNNGANCGGCISVSYKGKTITVMVSRPGLPSGKWAALLRSEIGDQSHWRRQEPSRYDSRYVGEAYERLLWRWRKGHRVGVREMSHS
jgi:hypothetical protein